MPTVLHFRCLLHKKHRVSVYTVGSNPNTSLPRVSSDLGSQDDLPCHKYPRYPVELTTVHLDWIYFYPGIYNYHRMVELYCSNSRQSTAQHTPPATYVEYNPSTRATPSEKHLLLERPLSRIGCHYVRSTEECHTEYRRC